MPRIESIERIWVDVPYKEVPARNMVRELPHWTLFELCKVTLDSGQVGVGETMVYYTWGTVSAEAERRALGANPAEIMWDDSLGAGLQMACFDAVGKSLQVPVWALLGKKVRDRAHIGWWAIDMPVEDWILECQEAIGSGYTSLKSKARPWWDLADQAERLCAAVPPHFKVDLDFNDFGLDPSVAKRLCKSLERFDQIAIWESPIRQEDVAGNRELRSHLHVPIAHHAGRPALATQLTQDMCDVFVVEGGAQNAIRHGLVCAEFNKPFWLQWVGTAITTAMSLHVQAVQTHARWPAINCHHMYQHPLIHEPIKVSNGMADIPEGPGLGIEIDWQAVKRYQIEPIAKPYPYPGMLLELQWPSGERNYFSHTMQMWEEFAAGRLPSFAPGIRLSRRPDDGTQAWKDLYGRACQGPVY